MPLQVTQVRILPEAPIFPLDVQAGHWVITADPETEDVLVRSLQVVWEGMEGVRERRREHGTGLWRFRFRRGDATCAALRAGIQVRYSQLHKAVPVLSAEMAPEDFRARGCKLQCLPQPQPLKALSPLILFKPTGCQSQVTRTGPPHNLMSKSWTTARDPGVRVQGL